MDPHFRRDEGYALDLDARDPLSGFRSQFALPDGAIYLLGNSLGPMPHAASAAVQAVLDEWRTKAVDGWLHADPPWFYLAERLGAQAAALVGAAHDEVVATGTTTVNIHALVTSFYTPQGARRKILADALDFPSDIFALQGQIALRGGDARADLVLVPSHDGRTLDEADVIARMTDDVALVFLPSVLYRSGQLLDIPALTRAARERGILIGFDCCHSAGAVPHRFDEWGVDFAVWCGYKYLNAGPGSTAFLYVNRRHFALQPHLAGWFGSAKERQFDMAHDFVPAPEAGRWQISSPSILSAAPLEVSLAILAEAGLDHLREKSLALTSYLIDLIDAELAAPPYAFRVGTPREPARRGGHVALERDEKAWEICAALKARGIVGDFRPPNVLRLAPAALFNTFHEVWRTVAALREIIDRGEHLTVSAEKSAIT